MTPRKARIIGYIILFASFPFFGLAGCFLNIAGGLLSMIFLVIGALGITVSVIWDIRKVRCPHCNTLLPLKLYDIRTCPYCGKNTDSNDEF